MTGILQDYDPLLTLLESGDFLFIDGSTSVVTTKDQETMNSFFVARMRLHTCKETLG